MTCCCERQLSLGMYVHHLCITQMQEYSGLVLCWRRYQSDGLCPGRGTGDIRSDMQDRADLLCWIAVELA